jgi:hypothetical protein
MKEVTRGKQKTLKKLKFFDFRFHHHLIVAHCCFEETNRSSTKNQVDTMQS